jgi:DNA-binding transcriptional LysR family regulator
MLILTELHVLAGLAEGKTLAQISQEVHLGQPTLSKLLRAAERRIGLRLVARRGRRLFLTAVGASLAQRAQGILSDVQQLDREIEATRAGESGLVRIIATRTPGSYLVPQLVGALQGKFPHVEVQLTVVGFEDVRQQVLRGQYDVGIAPYGGPPTESRLHIEQLYREPILFFVASTNPLGYRTDVSWEELRNATLVGPLSLPSWTQRFEHLYRLGLATRRQIDLSSPEAVKRLVEAGGNRYVGIHFRAVLVREFEDDRLAPIEVPGASVWLPYGVIRRQDLVMPRAPARLVAELIHGLSKYSEGNDWDANI